MRVDVVDGVEVIERRPDESGASGDERSVAYLPVGPHDLVAEGAAEWVAVRADAYASSERRLREAVAYAAREARTVRSSGPLRLVWLGSLGSAEPSATGPLGATFPLDGGLIVGRSAECAIVLRCGPHSDENLVARRHAVLELTAGVVRVRDLGSTQGTWIDGVRLELEGVLRPPPSRVDRDGATPS